MVNRDHIVSKFMEAKVSFELWVDSGIGLPMLLYVNVYKADFGVDSEIRWVWVNSSTGSNSPCLSITWPQKYIQYFGPTFIKVLQWFITKFYTAWELFINLYGMFSSQLVLYNTELCSAHFIANKIVLHLIDALRVKSINIGYIICLLDYLA
jgi:hypothetical protein